MAYYRENIVKQAQVWLGRKESDGSHKEIIDTYNAHTPRARGYKVKYTDAWCSTFASAVAIKCGYTAIIPTECGCQKHIQLFKDMGRWVENDGYTPKAGDFIFYDWGDSGKGDNTGYADHVGIVEKVEGIVIHVIEGNYSNEVKRRKLVVNGKYIRGFGVPKYDADSAPAPVASFTVGDKVKLTSDATVYGKTTRFSSWVYNSTLYVRQINGERVVVSTLKSGAVTGSVNKKHLKKV